VIYEAIGRRLMSHREFTDLSALTKLHVKCIGLALEIYDLANTSLEALGQVASTCLFLYQQNGIYDFERHPFRVTCTELITSFICYEAHPCMADLIACRSLAVLQTVRLSSICRLSSVHTNNKVEATLLNATSRTIFSTKSKQIEHVQFVSTLSPA